LRHEQERARDREQPHAAHELDHDERDQQRDHGEVDVAVSIDTAHIPA
jgi:hypothetical protein